MPRNYQVFIASLTPEQLAAYREKCRIRSSKWYENNKERAAASMKAYNTSPAGIAVRQAYYQKNKPQLLKRFVAYSKANRARITAQNREHRWQVKGYDVPPPIPFSFFRDVIQKAQYYDPIWQELLSLKLTAKQKQVVELARRGVSQVEQASILNMIQPGIAKMWNGNYDPKYPGEKQGGIYKKLLKARAKNKSK